MKTKTTGLEEIKEAIIELYESAKIGAFTPRCTEIVEKLKREYITNWEAEN